MAKTSQADQRKLEAPPNYADRSVQWRLMGIVGMVMCVFFLVKYGIVNDLWGLITGRPETWAQFSGKPADTEVDTKLPRRPADESPLAVRAIDVKQIGEPPSEPPEVIAPKPADKEPVAPVPPTEPGTLPGLDPASLKVVEDDAVIRGQENDAWYGLCALVAKTPPSDLAKRSLGPVRFVQLYRQPTVYRGKVVSISGSIRLAEKLEASKNAHGVAGYTKCILFPFDGSNSPIVFYVMDLPAGFPLGDKVDEKVTIHGVFYKRYAYMATDVPRTAPLLVARTFDWTPAVPKPPEEVPWGTLAVLVVLSAVIGVTIAVIAVRRHSSTNDEPPPTWDGMPKGK